ncbi:MAG: glycosyltransferase family 4 protein [Planctomycetaceae bacterium]|nr:glycosyltransferase family 4 protein [Planctomycetaceae bacterium]MBV8608266.1 glycosyltransferase family 4 protein [Singulisphaera sp.]
MSGVALACSGLGDVRRGNEAWARAMAEALHAAGEPVRLYGGGPLSDARCPYTRVWNVRRDWWGWPGRMTWGRRYAYEQQTFAWALVRRLRRDRPAVAHTADPVLAYRLSQAAPRGGFRLVYKDGLLLGPDWCRRFDWVQVLAPYYLDEAVKAGVRTDRWFVIPHVVDVTRFAPPIDRTAARHAVLGPAVPDDAFVVLAAGDFAPESNKRLDWVVSEVASLGPDSGVQLLLAGQAAPDHVRRVAELCRPLGDRAHLRPNTPPDRMPDLYRAADAFAHAALREPFGIVFIEALSSGLPAVGHPFPVTAWIIGAGGATADMTRPGELAGTLDRWRRDSGLRREAGAAGRDRAKSEFTAGRIVPLYRQLYAAVRTG